jgi:uncharacterized protein
MVINMVSANFFRGRYGLGVFLLLFSVMAGAVVGVPKITRQVTDLTGTLSPAQVDALENKLTAFEAKKGSQIAVLIVATTQSKDIAEFGIEVADLAQIGRKGIDDGVILIVAKDDRALRLEVGYGLEGVIPDVVAKRIIAETISPYFKSGDFAGGIDVGVTQLIKLIEGETLPVPTENSVGGQKEGTFMFILLGGLVVGFGLSVIMGRLSGGMLAGLVSGVLAAVFLGLALSLAVMLGLMVFFIVGIRQTGRRGWSNGGGFGGFSGGGSWGGGGGSFGGGGASGSW